MPGLGLLLFAGIVALIVFGVRKAIVASRERQALRTQHPDEPWMWRRDWAGRAVEDRGAIHPAFLWVFGILWTVISLPVVFVFERQMTKQPGLYFLALFPIVGACVLLWALYLSLRRRKYGLSLCRLERVPIPIGTTFRGEIQARVRRIPEEGFQLMLSSVRRVITGSGKNQNVRETVLWQEEQTLGSGAAMPYPHGMRIPFHFDLPANADPVDDSDPRDSVLWRLEVFADVPGIDYSARFELPVFRTAATPENQFDRPGPFVPTSNWTQSAGITFGHSRTGGEEIEVRPMRNFGDWFGNIAFLALWFGFLALARWFGAPLLVVLAFGAFGMVVMVVAIDFLTGRSRLHVDRSGVTVRRTWLGIPRARTIAAADIDTVIPSTGMTSGSRAYYNVVAVLQNGETTKLATNIRNKRDAEALAARVLRSVEKTSGFGSSSANTPAAARN